MRTDDAIVQTRRHCNDTATMPKEGPASRNPWTRKQRQRNVSEMAKEARKGQRGRGLFPQNPRLGVAIASGAQEGSPLRYAVVPGLVRRCGAAGRGILGNVLLQRKGKGESGGGRREGKRGRKDGKTTTYRWARSRTLLAATTVLSGSPLLLPRLVQGAGCSSAFGGLAVDAAMHAWMPRWPQMVKLHAQSLLLLHPMHAMRSPCWLRHEEEEEEAAGGRRAHDANRLPSKKEEEKKEEERRKRN